jgi:prepilin-type N-terminal cleavage/methylation domain-containing protein
MNSSRKGFTLIELLVVIAIIAILAAILFPVFAQAKEAAKKTAALSNVKQMATAFHIYSGDADDTFPRAWGYYPGSAYGHMTHYAHDVPFDWYPSSNPQYFEFTQGSWANLIQPYQKSIEMLTATGLKEVNIWAEDFSVAKKAIGKVGYAMNGTLSTYPASSVASPSQLPLVSQSRGAANAMGYAFASPVLNCPNADQPCRFVPSTPTCDATTQNGAWSGLLWQDPMPTMWAYSRGINVAFADSSAKFRKMGMNVGGKSDYRTDFFSKYNASGVPAAEWQDTNWCHTLLFQPDFEFGDYGTPVHWE